MLEFELLRTLSLEAPLSPDRPPFLSAASGLARIGDTLYVVADDELHLGVFAASGHAPGRMLRLLAGELPPTPRERKRDKPDFETLTLLPPFMDYPHGALLALGSGSKKRRHTGALQALGITGEPLGHALTIDAGALYERLRQEFDDLNIEGAAAIGAELVLLQRGNKGHRTDNATIHLALEPLLVAIASGAALPASPPRRIRRYRLGEVRGVPLCFTDAAALPGGELVFTAVAEDTDDSCADGACAGAAVGIIDADGRLTHIEPLERAYKVEGLHAWQETRGIGLLAVTDADDADVPAMLLRARWQPGARIY